MLGVCGIADIVDRQQAAFLQRGAQHAAASGLLIISRHGVGRRQAVLRHDFEAVFQPVHAEQRHVVPGEMLRQLDNDVVRRLAQRGGRHHFLPQRIREFRPLIVAFLFEAHQHRLQVQRAQDIQMPFPV
ncbi:hypothetical protein D3C71_1175720 [compost metagenome]